MISALFTYNYLKLKETNPALAYLCFCAINSHHTELKFQSDKFYDADVIEEPILVQREDLLKNCSDIIKDMNNPDINEEVFTKCLDFSHFTEHSKDFTTLYKRISNEKNLENFFLLVLLYSTLIDQDKLHAAKIEPHIPSLLRDTAITNHIRNKPNNPNIDNDREMVREIITQEMYGLKEEEVKTTKIFTITAPTGIGKTLSSLQAATILADKLREYKVSPNPKIIYAVPYINIIEQIKDEFEKICNNNDIKFLSHYSLDYNYHGDTDNYNEYLLTLEAWEADIILTTYVQLFQSLFSTKNKILKKINKLSGSIVVLDEVQSIPYRYLPLIGAVIKRLSHYYGTRFILMTATQPRIIEFGDCLDKEIEVKSKKLLPNSEDYFKKYNRTCLISLLEEEPINENTFIEKFIERYDKTKSALIVVNTIKRSINIYKRLCEDYKVLYLSNNIVPLSRQNVINEAKELIKNKVPFILVSTQSVEAGVDLNFDMAFRDIAPLPSIIQVAGRTNRNNELGQWPVYIVNIENDCSIYDTRDIENIKKIFKHHSKLSEEEYINLIETYYKDLYDICKEVLPDDSVQIWNGMKRLDFNETSNFRLIKNNKNYIDVFIELDENATKLIKEYIKKLNKLYSEKLNRDSYFRLRTDTKLTRKLMQQYFLSIPDYKFKDNEPFRFTDNSDTIRRLDFYFIPHDELGMYYDKITGYKFQ